MITRRAVVAGAATVAMSSMAGLLPADAAVTSDGSVCPNPPRPAQLVARPQRAVSLRQVTAALKSGRPVTLEKLTRLDGYIIDAANHDIVLWGLSEQGQPELQIQDFVVALRAAHDRYDNRYGNEVPFISIDPDPAVFLRLREIHAPDWTVPDVQTRYKEICKAP